MRLFELPAKVQMGPVAGGWCSRRVLLQATPSHVSWYNEARLLALVLSRQAKYKQWLPLEQDGDPSAGAAYSAAGVRLSGVCLAICVCAVCLGCSGQGHVDSQGQMHLWQAMYCCDVSQTRAKPGASRLP
jgi:hypothetical protein